MYTQPVSSPLNEKSLEDLEKLNLTSRQNTPQPSMNMATVTPTATSTDTSSPVNYKLSFAKNGQNNLSLKRPSKIPSKFSDKPLAFHMHEDEDEVEGEEYTQSTKVISIENGAMVEERETQLKINEPLVIKPPVSHNEHWLQRRLKIFRPDLIEGKPVEIDLSHIPDTIGDSTVAAGLQPTKPTIPTPKPTTESEAEIQVEDTPKTTDELARELLIKQAADPNSTSSTLANIIIPATHTPSESDIFSYDMAHLSDTPTLETYERVPVEAFGKGILLGLGWKEGTDLKGHKTDGFQEPKKRPDFLGIGAKEEGFLKIDAKGDKMSRKDGLGASWNPLRKIDKTTGEVIVEGNKDSKRGRRKDEPQSRDRSRERSREKDRSTDRSRNEDRSGASTPYKVGSRYGTPSDHDSGRDRDYDRPRRKDRHDRDKRPYPDDKERRNDSDQEWKHKFKDDSDRGSQDRDYDSDYYRKRRKGGDGDRSNVGSRMRSRR
jgi:hypothetical protein